MSPTSYQAAPPRDWKTDYSTAARRGDAVHPLAPVQARIQQALAGAFDPDRVFDRGRLFGATPTA